jgi:hypothetical protein
LKSLAAGQAPATQITDSGAGSSEAGLGELVSRGFGWAGPDARSASSFCASRAATWPYVFMDRGVGQAGGSQTGVTGRVFRDLSELEPVGACHPHRGSVLVSGASSKTSQVPYGDHSAGPASPGHERAAIALLGPPRRNCAPLQALSRRSYSSRIWALYFADTGAGGGPARGPRGPRGGVVHGARQGAQVQTVGNGRGHSGNSSPPSQLNKSLTRCDSAEVDVEGSVSGLREPTGGSRRSLQRLRGSARDWVIGRIWAYDRVRPGVEFDPGR